MVGHVYPPFLFAREEAAQALGCPGAIALAVDLLVRLGRSSNVVLETVERSTEGAPVCTDPRNRRKSCKYGPEVVVCVPPAHCNLLMPPTIYLSCPVAAHFRASNTYIVSRACLFVLIDLCFSWCFDRHPSQVAIFSFSRPPRVKPQTPNNRAGGFDQWRCSPFRCRSWIRWHSIAWRSS